MRKEFDFKNNELWKDYLNIIEGVWNNNKVDINEIRNIINNLYNKEIPDNYNNLSIKDYYISSLRNIIISLQGYALIDKTWTKKLADFIGNKKCLEIMSGCGCLSKALQDYGVDIISTDNFSWNAGSDSNWNVNKNYWTNIENIDCIKAIEKYGEEIDYIIMSWAYMDDNAYKSLLKMREVNPNCKMIVVGEGEGGCTASDEFFDEIKIIEDDTIEEINKIYPKWECIYDYIQLVK